MRSMVGVLMACFILETTYFLQDSSTSDYLYVISFLVESHPHLDREIPHLNRLAKSNQNLEGF